MKQGGPRARFDQQPIEANTMVEACVKAFDITRDQSWFDNAVMCFNWFLGQNDLNMPLYDAKTGGCRDGLMADGINQNEGAESSLAWLLSLMTLQKLYADEILNQPSSQKTVNKRISHAHCHALAHCLAHAATALWALGKRGLPLDRGAGIARS
jgi:hypothetical protein